MAPLKEAAMAKAAQSAGNNGIKKTEQTDNKSTDKEADKKKNFFHVKHLLQGTTQVAVWQDFICHFIIPWPHRGRKGDMDHEKWILGDSVICPVLRL